MVFDEMMKLFLLSRKRGTTGARKKAQPATLLLYEVWLGRFFGFMQERGRTAYEQIKKSDVLEFIDWIEEHTSVRGKAYSKATQLKLLRVLRTLFIWVGRDEDCQAEELKNWRNLLPVIEKSPRKDYIPDKAELKRFRGGFNTGKPSGHRDYVVFCLMLDTGIRIGEVCNLELDNMKLEENTLYVTGKTGSRLVPITREIVRMLRGYLRTRNKSAYASESTYVFLAKGGKQCTPTLFDQAFQKVAAKTGVSELTPHTLRHAFCTYYLQAGGGMAKLRNITGHKSFAMLLDYEHMAAVSGEEAKQELERVSPLKALTA